MSNISLSPWDRISLHSACPTSGTAKGKGCHCETITERFCQSRFRFPPLWFCASAEQQVLRKDIACAIGASTLFGPRAFAYGLRRHAQADRLYRLSRSRIGWLLQSQRGPSEAGHEQCRLAPGERALLLRQFASAAR